MYAYRLVKAENCKSINYIFSNSFLIHTPHIQGLYTHTQVYV